jgi:hypothetical protein
MFWRAEPAWLPQLVPARLTVVTEDRITWMVMARDVSHAVRILGESVIKAAMVLDVDTGLVRGLNVARTVEEALSEASSMALTKLPAEGIPVGRPSRVLVPVGMRGIVEATLASSGVTVPLPPVEEVIPDSEAEDIFDSFVGHLSGRTQMPDPPTPADWTLLYAEVLRYYKATPWKRHDDDVDFVVDFDIAGESKHYAAVVMGGAGVTYGLALYPDRVVRADLNDWKSSTPWPLPHGTLACTLDAWGEAPPEITARAGRYGWPVEADLVPTLFAADSPRGREFSCDDARIFSVATAALLAHDTRVVALAKNDAVTTGTVELGEFGKVAFTIRQSTRTRRPH